MLSVKQGYLAMFLMLVKYWDETKCDSLGAMLGSLNPFLFKGYISADPAAFVDWVNSVKKVTVKEMLTEDEAFEASLMFVSLYRNDFGFEVGWIIDDLGITQISDMRWNDGVDRAREYEMDQWD
jgi:hypothetical protein